jgi:general nucleoside transport system permease protein
MSTAVLVQRRALSVTREKVFGVLFLVLAGAMALLFGLGSESGTTSTFVLNVRGVAVELPDLVVPSRETSLMLAVVCAFLGGVQVTRGFGRRTYLVLGAVVALFVLAFLTWAARDASMNLVGMLSSSLLRAVPITLGALSGVLCERAGVINIAIEGMMLTAAFTGALVGSATGSLWMGMLGGIAAGALLGSVLAVLSIRYRVEQIIGGTVINIFAIGITSYLTASILARYAHLNNPGRFPIIEIPGLSRIPVLGPILFANNIYVYLMFVLIALVTLALFRTRWGLRVRSVGEHPRAADTVGIKVLGTRYASVILGGAMAGLAGSYFTLGSVGRFDQEMTGGRGFIALAAMIFGRWHPMGAFGAALVFGFADALQNRLAILRVPIPSEFLLMAPYIATILVVAGVVGGGPPGGF